MEKNYYWQVVLTQPTESAAPLVELLENTEATLVHLPLIEIRPRELSADDRKIVSEAHTYNWWVFTSKNGVRHFFEQLQATGGAVGRAKIAAVGGKTAGLIRQMGYKVDFVNTGVTSDEMGESFGALLQKTDRVLLLQGNLATPKLAETLNQTAQVTRLDVYETIYPEVTPADIHRIFLENPVSCVVFTSPSAVRRLHELMGGLLTIIDHKVICIGKTTAQAAYDTRYLHDCCIPDSPSVESIFQKVNYISNRIL